MWVRGLKPCLKQHDGGGMQVASYVGAWIETVIGRKVSDWLKVASYVGAWIETDAKAALDRITASHPMWVRGLKQAK